mmetsp:Transcript_22433/g.50088  ORF Transcript_22433/g.50088 Transcript_22433/m.50088 type:complete len:255 (+) Transcript_22433:101-865(+)
MSVTFLRRSSNHIFTASKWASKSSASAVPATSVGFDAASRSYHSSTPPNSLPTYHGTTILCVRKNGKVCMMGDGMVSMGNMVVKPNAVKIQRLFPKGGLGSTVESKEENEQKATLVGFAGATADAFTLLERLEGKLDEYPGQLSRSCVELAKGWRTDKYLRRLEASLIVADENKSLEITGNGDVLEMSDGVISIGSGSPFALAAARALMTVDEMSAEEVAQKAMDVASDMCVYTNKEFLSYTLDDVGETPEEES